MGPIQFTIQAILIFSAIFLLNKYFSKTLPHEVSTTGGMIKPSRVLSAFCVVICGLFLSLGLLLSFSNEDQLIGLICSGMALFGGIVMLPSLFNFHDVSWDESGVTGPTGKSFPKFPTRQVTIEWKDIVKLDEAWSNYKYVESTTGQRVFWGYWYAGERKLRDKIQKRLNNESI